MDASNDICQDCYAIARPDRYFPETFRYGTCAACGQPGFVARIAYREIVTVRNTLAATLPQRGDAGTRPLVTRHEGEREARWDGRK